MKLVFSGNAWEDYLYWQKTDKHMLRRINSLICEILRDPFTGSGKPEPLKHGLSGYWSHRINDEHRLVYRPAEPKSRFRKMAVSCQGAIWGIFQKAAIDLVRLPCNILWAN